MAGIQLDKLSGLHAAQEQLTTANVQAEEVPKIVQAAQANLAQQRQELIDEVLTHPELSDVQKAGWLIAIWVDKSTWGWKEYKEMPIEERASVITDPLEAIDAQLQPGAPILRAAPRYELLRHWWENESRTNPKIAATDLFRLGIVGQSGLHVNLGGPNLSIDVNAESTPPTDPQSAFNRWDIPTSELVQRSYASAEAVRAIENPEDIFAGIRGLTGENLLIVGHEATVQYLSGLISFKNAYAETSTSEPRHRHVMTGFMEEAVLAIFTEAKKLGLDFSRATPAIATEIELKKLARIRELGKRIGYNLVEYEHHPNPELTEVDLALGVDEAAIKEAAMADLHRRFEEKQKEVSSLVIKQPGQGEE